MFILLVGFVVLMNIIARRQIRFNESKFTETRITVSGNDKYTDYVYSYPEQENRITCYKKYLALFIERSSIS